MTLYKNVSDTEWQAGYIQTEEVLEVKDAPVEIDPNAARIKELETTLTDLATTLEQESDLLNEAEEKLDRIASIVGEL
jgi:ABC-type transporter Mla subunit MlaD